MLIDASRLGVIERQYGAEAYIHALSNLVDLIRELVGDDLAINDFSREKMDATATELAEERDAVRHLL